MIQLPPILNDPPVACMGSSLLDDVRADSVGSENIFRFTMSSHNKFMAIIFSFPNLIRFLPNIRSEVEEKLSTKNDRFHDVSALTPFTLAP